MTRAAENVGGWLPISSAPWLQVIEVRNPSMDEPCLATRGYQTDSGVHSDDTFCTSVFTPHKSGIHCLGFPAGKLVCPTEWRRPLQEPALAGDGQ